MKEFRVRAGTPEDVAGVVALERATLEAPHWSEAEYVAAVGGGEEYVRRGLFVADAEGLVGFAVGKVAGDLAELESVVVDSRARRWGIGRALCSGVIDWCRQQGAGAIELEVRAASVGAIGLYGGLGFLPGGRRPGYYSEPADDALLMRLELLKSA